MAQNKKECPDCHAPLQKVLLSDLIGERKEQGIEVVSPQAKAVFEYFDFYVCGQCGRTLIYAGVDAREAAMRKSKASGGTLRANFN